MTAFRQQADVDELLPLDLDPEYRRTFGDPTALLQWARPSRRDTYELHIHEFGADIVNSISIHPLPSEKIGLEDEIVALLT